ncbi:MAG: hypothetical protein WA731_21410 [Pseudonocardiaceae bacterium]|nr:hypothetical protein [Pseudonocardiaceae bacterium]
MSSTEATPSRGVFGDAYASRTAHPTYDRAARAGWSTYSRWPTPGLALARRSATR